MKKFLSISLIISVVILFFSGCGSSISSDSLYNKNLKVGDTGGLKLPLDKNNTVITAIIGSEYALDDSYSINKLREATGVNLKIESVPNATIGSKLKVLIGSKDLPDIFPMVGTVGDVNDLALQGAFAPVNDYLDEMPNFKKLFVDNEECNWIMKSYAAADGKVYIIPSYDVQREVNHGMLYRKDIFDKHSIPMWNNPDEFYYALKKLKEIYPNSTPFVSKNAEGIVGKLGTSWGVANTDLYYDEEEKIWKYSDTDPKTKEILDLLKRLYDEGLIDPEFLTTTQAAWTNKMTQYDKAFVTFDWIGRLDMFKEQTKDTIPDYDLRYGNPVGPKQTIKRLSKVFGGTNIVKNNNTELTMKFVDFLLSPAGAELTTMGVEGETYVLNERGYASYPELGGFEKVQTIDELGEKYGLFQFYKRADRRASYFDYTEREKEAQDYAKDPNRMEPDDPQLVFTDEEKQIIAKYMSGLKKEANQFFMQYILGDKKGDSAWDEWIQRADRLGVNELVKVYNEAQKRFDAM